MVLRQAKARKRKYAEKKEFERKLDSALMVVSQLNFFEKNGITLAKLRRHGYTAEKLSIFGFKTNFIEKIGFIFSSAKTRENALERDHVRAKVFPGKTIGESAKLARMIGRRKKIKII